MSAPRAPAGVCGASCAYEAIPKTTLTHPSTTKMTYVYGPFVTGIVFNPEVDMVLLDGAWWRVTEDDGVFTVREKVADDSL